MFRGGEQDLQKHTKAKELSSDIRIDPKFFQKIINRKLIIWTQAVSVYSVEGWSDFENLQLSSFYFK